jgi:hypothetical protein
LAGLITVRCTRPAKEKSTPPLRWFERDVLAHERPVGGLSQRTSALRSMITTALADTAVHPVEGDLELDRDGSAVGVTGAEPQLLGCSLVVLGACPPMVQPSASARLQDSSVRRS